MSIEMTKELRAPFEEALTNMYSNNKYKEEYMYYAHLTTQCKLHFTEDVAVAGVIFMYDTFNLYINPLGKKLPEGTTDKNGNPIERDIGFNALPLEQRMGVLKHECMHILLNHISRKQDRNHTTFNRASDCALNQSIKRDHLPEGALYPDNLINSGKVPDNLTAEQYYELIEEDEDNGGGQGPGQGHDDHDKWEESEGSPDLQKDIAKGMAERAANATQKAIDKLPAEFSDWMTLLSRTHEVNWKDVLRFIFGNVKSDMRRTISRVNRMLPEFEWLKGKTFNRSMTPLIISDVSGSVSDQAALSLWGETRGLCEEMQAEAWLIQVDTQPALPERLTADTKVIERKACGGTFLSPAIDMAKEHNIEYDVIVVTTDGYLSNNDVVPFSELGVPVVWLIEADGTIMPQMTKGNMQAFKLKA